MDVRSRIINKLHNQTYPVYNIRQNEDYNDVDDTNIVSIVVNQLPKYLIYNYDYNTTVKIIELNNKYQELAQIISAWLPGADTVLSHDMQLNLLHYIIYDGQMFILNQEERAYLMTVDINDLLQLLGPNYVNKPLDYASLLFAALRGKSSPVPNIVDVARYTEISGYDFKTAMELDELLYDNSTDTRLPLYVRLSQVEKATIEPLFVTVNDQNVNKYMREYGIFFNRNSVMSAIKNKIRTFRINIIQYEEVFNREPNIVMPDPVYLYQNSNLYDVAILLEKFTNKELFEKYYLNNLNKAKNRSQLITKIARNIMSNKWSANRHGNCLNDDGMNIISGIERRIDHMNVDDDDLLLSYGSNYHYNCYTITELMGSFRRDGEDYIFTNPDHNPLDPASQAEFRPSAIAKLYNYLTHNDYEDKYPEFIRFLAAGYRSMKNRSYDQVVSKQIEQYSKLDSISKQQIERFVIWLFYYSIYMRFWKGPGHPYPMKTINVTGGERGELCYPPDRNENIFIQQGVLDRMKMNWTDATSKWVDDMNLVEYDFVRHTSKVTKRKLHDVLQKVAMGRYCMGIAGDEFIATSNYYLTHMSNADINQIIKTELDSLLGYEMDVINIIVNDTKNMVADTENQKLKHDKKILFLENKMGDIIKYRENPQDPIVPFTMETITYNTHT